MQEFENHEIISPDEFREKLLQIMEKKDHWADPAFAGLVPKEKMIDQFKNDYEVFVRDFPDYMEEVLKRCPVKEIQDDLRENMEEERTGEHHAGAPHPELFLKIPQGFGFDMEEFKNIKLGPAGQAYKDFLWHASKDLPWEVGAAVSTLFLEGNKYERAVFDSKAEKRPEKPLEEHPLALNYGVPLEALELIRIHRELDSSEGDHRLAAWKMLLGHVEEPARPKVLEAMEQALKLWTAWRDEVAAACGVEKGEDEKPRLV